MLRECIGVLVLQLPLLGQRQGGDSRELATLLQEPWIRCDAI
jgi:hypothetical protein